MTLEMSAISASLFDVERLDDTIIVTPLVDLREVDYERIESSAKDILELLNGMGVKNVVLDFYMTDYYGSTALGFFIRIWKRVKMQNGRMAFCNLSNHEKEILQITHLDRLWPLCASRQAALKAVGNRAACSDG